MHLVRQIGSSITSTIFARDFMEQMGKAVEFCPYDCLGKPSFLHQETKLQKLTKRYYFYTFGELCKKHYGKKSWGLFRKSKNEKLLFQGQM